MILPILLGGPKGSPLLLSTLGGETNNTSKEILAVDIISDLKQHPQERLLSLMACSGRLERHDARGEVRDEGRLATRHQARGTREEEGMRTRQAAGDARTRDEERAAWGSEWHSLMGRKTRPKNHRLSKFNVADARM